MMLLVRGGWVMIPLAVCSLAALTVIVERLLVLLPLRRRTRAFIGQVDPCLREGNVEKAEALCRGADTPMARILEAGFRRAGQPPETVAAALRDAAVVAIPPLHTRVGLLSTLAQISTLLGFLGTVTGMIHAFQSVELQGAAGGMIGTGDLAGGIWEALITTAAGLIIAIPTWIAFYALSSLVNALIVEMERCAHEVAERLALRRAGEAGRSYLAGSPSTTR
jgi:biopolymer transport protein ExbB